MIRIVHRVNTVAQLRQVPPEYGVEIDLRDRGTEIVLHHDPFRDGERLHDYLRHFRHRFLILNMKCEGIEEASIGVARGHGIDNFFILDATVPAMVKLARRGERRFAVRFSEWEPLEACLAMTNLATWIWVDCFSNYPARPGGWNQALTHFRVCLVSPELHGHTPPDAVGAAIISEQFTASAVCTKYPEVWRTALASRPELPSSRGCSAC